MGKENRKSEGSEACQLVRNWVHSHEFTGRMVKTCGEACRWSPPKNCPDVALGKRSSRRPQTHYSKMQNFLSLAGRHLLQTAAPGRHQYGRVQRPSRRDASLTLTFSFKPAEKSGSPLLYPLRPVDESEHCSVCGDMEVVTDRHFWQWWNIIPYFSIVSSTLLVVRGSPAEYRLSWQFSKPDITSQSHYTKKSEITTPRGHICSLPPVPGHYTWNWLLHL